MTLKKWVGSHYLYAAQSSSHSEAMVPIESVKTPGLIYSEYNIHSDVVIFFDRVRTVPFRQLL